jgi:hypothetical protein
MKYLSGALILITIYFNFKHGLSGVTMNMSPAEEKMMADIGIGRQMFVPIGIFSFLICILVLFPQTYLVGNMVNAAFILLIMCLALYNPKLRNRLF